MKALEPENKEADIHNLIAPKHSEFKDENFITDLYNNNVWILMISL